MSPSVFYLTVLILWAVSIFLIVEATGRTKLRKEYPGRKDEALRTLTFSTSLLSAAAMVSALAVFLIAIAGGYSSRSPEDIRTHVLYLSCGSAFLLLLLLLFGSWFTIPRPTVNKDKVWGPGWLVHGKTCVYIQAGQAQGVNSDMYFYGSERTKRESALPLKGGAVASIRIDFLPNPGHGEFWSMKPEWYIEIVDLEFKDFEKALRDLENPTEERVCDLANSFQFEPRVIAKIESIKLGEEIFNIQPKAEITEEPAEPAAAESS